MTELSVFIQEDQEDCLYLYGEVLSEYRTYVDIPVSVVDAISIVQEKYYDLYILDIFNCDNGCIGLELLDHIDLNKCLIICDFISTHFINLFMKNYGLDKCRVLEKPSSFQQISTSVESILSGTCSPVKEPRYINDWLGEEYA